MIWLGAIALWGGTARAADVQVELYTMGPGDEVFSRFGHAALCLVSDARSLCYNYGVTTFEVGRLTRGFLRGTAQFWVASSTLPHMLDVYRMQDRTVWRQQIDLPLEARHELAQRLVHDDMPAHRFYVYDHFHDNCSTRLRDHLDAVTDGALSARTKSVPWDRSLRQVVREGLSPSPLLAAGTELVLGAPLDETPTVWEAMFLPDVLREQVAHILGSVPEVVAEAHAVRGSGWPSAGSAVLGAGGVLGAVCALLGRGRAGGLRRFIALGAAGTMALVGVTLWLIVLAGVPRELTHNWAALLFWPSDLALATRWGARYAQLRAAIVVLLSLAAATGIVAQPLYAPALLALGLIFAARSSAPAP